VLQRLAEPADSPPKRPRPARKSLHKAPAAGGGLA